MVAWLPLICFNAFLPLFMLNNPAELEPGTSAPLFLLLWMLLGCGGACVQLLALCGVVYSVARPRRGIQDLLAGTCLVPR